MTCGSIFCHNSWQVSKSGANSGLSLFNSFRLCAHLNYDRVYVVSRACRCCNNLVWCTFLYNCSKVNRGKSAIFQLSVLYCTYGSHVVRSIVTNLKGVGRCLCDRYSSCHRSSDCCGSLIKSRNRYAVLKNLHSNNITRVQCGGNCAAELRILFNFRTNKNCKLA